MNKSEMKKAVKWASSKLPEDAYDWMKQYGAVDQIKLFDHLRKEIETLETPLKARKALLETMKTGTIPAQMEMEEIEQVRVEGIGTAYLSSVVRASIQQGRKEAAFDWLRENSLGDLITETVSASTLSATFKDRVKEGNPPPASVFHTFVQTRVNLRKS